MMVFSDWRWSASDLGFFPKKKQILIELCEGVIVLFQGIALKGDDFLKEAEFHFEQCTWSAADFQ